jgi:hypothetical protein
VFRVDPVLGGSEATAVELCRWRVLGELVDGQYRTLGGARLYRSIWGAIHGRELELHQRQLAEREELEAFKAALPPAAAPGCAPRRSRHHAVHRGRQKQLKIYSFRASGVVRRHAGEIAALAKLKVLWRHWPGENSTGAGVQVTSDNELFTGSFGAPTWGLPRGSMRNLREVILVGSDVTPSSMGCGRLG